MKQTVKKGDKGEQIVIQELEKDKGEHYLINNLILIGDNDVSHQFDHILIRHNGVFVIETKNYYGEISGSIEDTYWNKSYLHRGKRIDESFMNPIKQNKAHIRFLKKVLGRDIPFINFVVFINNDVKSLGIYTVTNEKQLLNKIQMWEIDKPLTSKVMSDINKTLLYLEADIQSEDHVKNIKVMKKNRK